MENRRLNQKNFTILKELLPEEINDLLDKFQNYRKTLDRAFKFKVNEMNKSILKRNDTNRYNHHWSWSRRTLYCI